MADLLEQELTGAPVSVSLGGNSYLLGYGMAAVIVYKRETARIERSRPQLELKDPRCICGEPRSQHTGPDLIILGEDQKLLCWSFRLYDPVEGDSLLSAESWKRIDLDLDPERWLACLWAGLHRLSQDGTKWEAPMTLAALGSMIPVGAGTRTLSVRMVQALKYSSLQPRKDEPDPNAAAPAASAPAQNPSEPNPTSNGSTPAPAVVSELTAANS